MGRHHCQVESKEKKKKDYFIKLNENSNSNVNNVSLAHKNYILSYKVATGLRLNTNLTFAFKKKKRTIFQTRLLEIFIHKYIRY